MPASEIDDIFAGKTTSIKSAKAKGKEKSILETDATTLKDKKKKKKRKHEAGDESTERKVEDGQGTSEGKKRKKKRKVEGTDGETDVAPSSSAKPVPETVFDPSLTLNRGVTKPNRHNLSSHKVSEKSGKSRTTSRSKKDEGESEDIQRFKDSRGTGPRTSGFLYKV